MSTFAIITDFALQNAPAAIGATIGGFVGSWGAVRTSMRKVAAATVKHLVKPEALKEGSTDASP